MTADGHQIRDVVADRGYTYKNDWAPACTPSASTPSPTSTPTSTARAAPTPDPASSPEPHTA